MLVTSIFSFSHNVFKRCSFKGSSQVGIVWQTVNLFCNRLDISKPKKQFIFFMTKNKICLNINTCRYRYCINRSKYSCRRYRPESIGTTIVLCKGHPPSYQVFLGSILACNTRKGTFVCVKCRFRSACAVRTG